MQLEICYVCLLKFWGLSHYQHKKLDLGVALLFLCTGFGLKLIKISLKSFGFVSSIFMVVLGRCPLQRLNHSGTECSFSCLFRTSDATMVNEDRNNVYTLIS